MPSDRELRVGAGAGAGAVMIAAIVGIAAVTASPAPAAAEPPAAEPPAAEPPAEPPAAPVVAPHLIHVPTAWLQPRGASYSAAGASHRRGGFFSFAAGLAGIAELDVGVTDAIAACDPCTGDARAVSEAWVGVATFKVGVAPDLWFRGQPALVLGFTRSFAAQPPSWSDVAPELAELYLAASVAVGAGVRLHGGATAWDSVHRAPDGVPLRLRAPGAAPPVRPFAGVEWTPDIYPKTTLVADLSWVPEFAPDGADLRWIAGWGVRYQALSWGSIELAVRHREADDLSGSTVLVRVNAIAR